MHVVSKQKINRKNTPITLSDRSKDHKYFETVEMVDKRRDDTLTEVKRETSNKPYSDLYMMESTKG